MSNTNIKGSNTVMANALIDSGINIPNNPYAPKHTRYKRSNNLVIDNSELPPVDFYKEDGVDFININSWGETDLGKFLSPEYSHVQYDEKTKKERLVPFKHPIFDKFLNITALRFYIKSASKNNVYRKMSSRSATTYFYEHPEDRLSYVKNELALIAYAMWERVKSNENIVNMLIESDLPFDSYKTRRTPAPASALPMSQIKDNETVYVLTRSRSRYSGFNVYVYNKIRDYLKNNPDTYMNGCPDFENLRDDPQGNIYEPYAVFETVVKKEPEDNAEIDDNIGNRIDETSNDYGNNSEDEIPTFTETSDEEEINVFAGDEEITTTEKDLEEVIEKKLEEEQSN